MKCPSCKGEGGYTEPVLEDGSGPYYKCLYCDDYTTVNLCKWFKWYMVIIINWTYYNTIGKFYE